MALLVLLLPLVRSLCPSTTITSSSTGSLVERSTGVYTPSVLVTPHPAWATLAGASWIWESSAQSLGPFKYQSTFTLAEWARTSISGLKLHIAADNRYAVTFNGVVVAPQWTGSYNPVKIYELKQWAVGSSEALGVQENSLVILALNSGGPAGLIYKLEVVY